MDVVYHIAPIDKKKIMAGTGKAPEPPIFVRIEFNRSFNRSARICNDGGNLIAGDSNLRVIWQIAYAKAIGDLHIDDLWCRKIRSPAEFDSRHSAFGPSTGEWVS